MLARDHLGVPARQGAPGAACSQSHDWVKIHQDPSRCSYDAPVQSGLK